MSSDNNNPTSIGGDQSLLLSASTGSRFTMHSSAAQSGNVAHLTEKLSADEVAIIFGFLSHADIMRARVCTTWRDAAKKTLVPPTDTDFRVDSMRSYNAMRVMATALPNFQQLSIFDIGHGHKYSDGEDPDERRATVTANCTSHDINIISSFRKLRSLEIFYCYFLNGRYPVFFNFPLLQRLSITNCSKLKWDLEMLASFPLLRELLVCNSNVLTGNLSSLRALRDTLEMVKIVGGGGLSPDIHIRGNFIDLAAFPRLKELDLRGTKVTGDIRDINEHDFPALESLRLPKSVRGGMNYKFQNISDVPDFIHTIYLLLQRTPTLFDQHLLSYAFFGWTLSEDSPDWYDRDDGSETPFPPFVLRFIQAGSRLGWRWCGYDDEEYYYEDECHSCEINWLDPEPSSESNDYEAYTEALQRVEQSIDFYRGYYEPPTAEEYRRLCEGLEQRD